MASAIANPRSETPKHDGLLDDVPTDIDENQDAQVSMWSGVKNSQQWGDRADDMENENGGFQTTPSKQENNALSAIVLKVLKEITEMEKNLRTEDNHGKKPAKNANTLKSIIEHIITDLNLYDYEMKNDRNGFSVERRKIVDLMSRFMNLASFPGKGRSLNLYKQIMKMKFNYNLHDVKEGGVGKNKYKANKIRMANWAVDLQTNIWYILQALNEECFCVTDEDGEPAWVDEILGEVYNYFGEMYETLQVAHGTSLKKEIIKIMNMAKNAPMQSKGAHITDNNTNNKRKEERNQLAKERKEVSKQNNQQQVGYAIAAGKDKHVDVTPVQTPVAQLQVDNTILNENQESVNQKLVNQVIELQNTVSYLEMQLENGKQGDQQRDITIQAQYIENTKLHAELKELHVKFTDMAMKAVEAMSSK